jgi:hypothetical protein
MFGICGVQENIIYVENYYLHRRLSYLSYIYVALSSIWQLVPVFDPLSYANNVSYANNNFHCTTTYTLVVNLAVGSGFDSFSFALVAGDVILVHRKFLFTQEIIVYIGN